MIINIVFGLVFVSLVVYLAVQMYGKSKSPKRIADEEFEQEQRRRERRRENLRRIQEHVQARGEELGDAVRHVADALEGKADLVVENDQGVLHVQLGETSYSAAFRLPEFDLDERNLDVEAYADAYGKYVLEVNGDRREFASLDEIVRALARSLARQVDDDTESA